MWHLLSNPEDGKDRELHDTCHPEKTSRADTPRKHISRQLEHVWCRRLGGSLFALGCRPMARATRMIRYEPSFCIASEGERLCVIQRQCLCVIQRQEKKKMPGVRVRAPGGSCLGDLPLCMYVCVCACVCVCLCLCVCVCGFSGVGMNVEEVEIKQNDYRAACSSSAVKSNRRGEPELPGKHFIYFMFSKVSPVST